MRVRVDLTLSRLDKVIRENIIGCHEERVLASEETEAAAAGSHQHALFCPASLCKIWAIAIL
jgi:hypothetical protein